MRKLGRVADVPALEIDADDLGMKLQREAEITQRKSLVRVLAAAREQRRGLRQIERVAMPVEHFDAGLEQRREIVRRGLVAWIDGRPADLLAVCAGKDLG